MDHKHLVRISKQLSWILRHQAEQFQLPVDPEGFVPIDEVLALLHEAIPGTTEEMLHKVVDTIEPQKQRFSIVDRYIRANYGHSLEKTVIYAPAQPPSVLYHGTTLHTTRKILDEGLRPMNRQFVHLTVDLNLARQIGARHGAPCILTVDAKSAHEGGAIFHNANRGFWLTLEIPSKYLHILKT